MNKLFQFSTPVGPLFGQRAETNVRREARLGFLLRVANKKQRSELISASMKLGAAELGQKFQGGFRAR